MLANGHLITAADMLEAIGSVRAKRRDLLTQYGSRGLQELAARAVADVARRFGDPEYPPRQLAESAPGVFPFAMTWVSLERLLDSLYVEELFRLIDTENCSGKLGPEVIGHIIASNTPLLGWTSVIRALLVGAGSLVKAPSSPNSVWLKYLVDALWDVSPELSGLVALASWSGGDDEIERAVLPRLDLVVAYGDDDTISSIKARSGEIPVVEYGHRLSIAFVLDDADCKAAADGLAVDVAMFDQGGCLSPQTVFVEGDFQRAEEFGRKLADSLNRCKLPKMIRDSNASGKIQEARMLAQFEPGTVVYAGVGLSTTVVVRRSSCFVPSPGHCVVNVIPWKSAELAQTLANVAGKLQGASISAKSLIKLQSLADNLRILGVSYICKPGYMQCPGISWRENNLDVLASLLLR